MTARAAISVVVPVLDEERRVTELLRHLEAVLPGAERIVVDGGSRDDTCRRVEDAGGARLVRAARGRAVQLNAGAAVARGDVLLFLHADVRLPADAGEWMSRALADPGVVAGAFRTWTVADGPSRPPWAPLLHLADLRSRYTRRPYGDQGLFVRARVFHEVGGYPSQALMEDYELSRRLGRVGNVRIVPARVQVSGRRFLARPWFFTAVVNLFPVLYRLGVPPEALARLYANVR
ncbi:MAG: TIGR04283 family arsenosugar biosynthesis glycosyltransferase [Polyangiaceae bacterium]|nr:TIGR04283 family arsenosugar biosynthesis glycosyltransferase [Polyangiaceae bacterium]